MTNRYRVFRRRWWKDSKCTEPGAGRKTHICFAISEDEARRICAEYNCDSEGKRIKRPYGVAYEYERV